MAVASPDISLPVARFNSCARFTNSPPLTPALTASRSFSVRTCMPPMLRPFQLSDVPATDGSVGTPSRIAEPLI